MKRYSFTREFSYEGYRDEREYYCDDFKQCMDLFINAYYNGVLVDSEIVDWGLYIYDSEQKDHVVKLTSTDVE